MQTAFDKASGCIFGYWYFQLPAWTLQLTQSQLPSAQAVTCKLFGGGA